jgi:hypothetical protein
MQRDQVIAELELLIDGELARPDRCRLLGQIADDAGVRALLSETLALEADLGDLAALYDAAEPSPAAVQDVLAAVGHRGPVAATLAGLGAIARRLLTPLDDGRLAGVMAGSAPPPVDQGDAGAADPSGEAPDEVEAPPPEVKRAPVVAKSETVFDPADGRVIFVAGAGSVRASARVTIVDLGAAGPMENGLWHLALDTGRVEKDTPGRLKVRGTPGVAGRIVLLDGSTLVFASPLTIVWRPD